MNDLNDYVKTQREKGVSDAAIKEALESVGWKSPDISSALDGDENKQDIPKPPQKKSYPNTFTIKFAGVFLVLLALVVIGGYFAYESFYMTPHRIVSQSAKKMQAIETYKYSADFEIMLGEEPLNPLEDVMSGNIIGGISELFSRNYLITTSGVVDTSDQQSPLSSSTASIVVGAVPLGSLELITSLDDGYFKLHQNFGVDYFDGIAVPNRWIKVNLNELDVPKEDSEVIANTMYRLLPRLIELPLVELSKADEVRVNNTRAYRIVGKVDKDVLAADIISYFESLDSTELDEVDKVEFAEFMERVRISQVQLIIGKYDSYLYGVDLQVEVMEDDNLTRESLTIIDVDLSNHDDTVSIIPPTDWVDIFGKPSYLY